MGGVASLHGGDDPIDTDAPPSLGGEALPGRGRTGTVVGRSGKGQPRCLPLAARSAHATLRLWHVGTWQGTTEHIRNSRLRFTAQVPVDPSRRDGPTGPYAWVGVADERYQAVERQG